MTVATLSRRQEILQRREQRPPIDFDPEGVPASLIKLHRWVLWDWQWNGKKWNKVPFQSDGRRNASSTDQNTWTTFDDAVSSAIGLGMGIGFVFNGDGIAGIDFDDCRDPTTGAVADWAAEKISLLNTYTEISPSGTGFKAFVLGKLPDGCRKQYECSDGGEIEVYERGRFFTATGHRAQGTPDEVNDRQEELTAIIETVLLSTEPAGNLVKHQVDASQPAAANPGDDLATVEAALEAIDADAHYTDWITVGMAIKSSDPSPNGLALFDNWCRRGSKYVEGEPARKWASFQSGGITVATLAYMADQSGRDWRPKRAPQNVSGCRQKSSQTSGKTTYVDVDTLQQGKFTPFPVNLLPEPIKGFVDAGSLSIGCDPSAIAIASLVACAAAVGNSRVVRLKNDWFEPAILWAALVARSGDRKSPAIALALQALRERQKRALKEYDRRHEQWLSSEMAQYESDLASWKKSKRDNRGEPPEKPKEPVAWRVMVDDCTIEALGDRLAKQPRGLLLACDELSAWLGSFQRYKAGGGSDAPKWLEVHGGRMLLIDRKGGDKKTLCIPRAAVSIVGTIQPSILRAALTPEHRANGMAARLFLAMPPTRPRQWSEHEIPEYVSGAVSDLFDQLLSLEMLPGEHIDDDPRPSIIQLQPEAKELFVQFVNEHGVEQSDMPGDMAAVWSKLEGGAARIALVHHLIRCAIQEIAPSTTGHIDATSMAAGIALARWFGREAQRVESLFSETDDQRDARELVEWIEKRGGCVTARDLQNSNRRYSRSADLAEAALAQLAKSGLGKTSVIQTGGRPRFEFVLNSSHLVDIDRSQKTSGTAGLLSTRQPGEEG